MISKLRAFGAFWYDFIIGDDWSVALGVTVAFAVTYALSRATTAAIWWIIPVAVATLLPVSIYRVTRRNT
jgi:UDP-N-acetylmuramyl pentapeptide phosphotransferase/UDP-N-acetylglucosamine-1-phosphate transferase